MPIDSPTSISSFSLKKPTICLNRVEIEIGLFERGCLGRRVSTLIVFQQRVAAFEAECNAAIASID